MAKDHEMSHDEWQTFNHDKKMFKLLNDNRYYCRCGHSLVIMPTRQNKLCQYCGRLVFRDKELQEIYDKEMDSREKRMNFKKEMRRYL